MAKKYKITRRDFLNGVAMGVTAGASLSPLETVANFSAGIGEGGYYPPKLTGMRGDHVGSFEVSHKIAWLGETWSRPADQTDATYDLVVVGGGISGLSAAWMYRAQTGPEVRILILDPHDDFGGAATRNEFTVDGHHLIGYGGSMSIDEPKHYSPAAKQLLKNISIDVQRFYKYFDRGFYDQWNLKSGIYFNRDAFQVDRLLPDPFRNSFTPISDKPANEIIGMFPVSKAARDALIRLVESDIDYLAGIPGQEKIEILRSISYVDFLEKYVGVPREGTDILRNKAKGLWALGWDALSALEGARNEMPGTTGMGLTYKQLGWEAEEEPFIFHFPDGNAGISRSLVRGLIPGSLPGNTMEDLVTSRANYATLDRENNKVRIRLNSTAIDVRHTKDGKAVDVTYVQKGVASRVRGKHIILACNNRMIPFICPEVPAAQARAIDYAIRAPLAYVNVVLRNWRGFVEAGFDRFYIPESNMVHSWDLDYPVSMGSYHFSKGPDDPIVLHGSYVPNSPGLGLDAREQFALGQQRLYQQNFADFEDDVFQTFGGALSGTSFDAERDIAAITVNRWPHGYAYEYNELFDPADWGPERGPHIAGRAQIGRISIANSDASASAYIDGAIDAAARAVKEQVNLT